MDLTMMTPPFNFPTETACFETLFQAKWPNGFICSRCGHRHAYQIHTRRLPLYECHACHYQNSLIAGTVMEGSRTDIRKWLHAIFLISRTDSGINAKHLSKVIRVTYKTAWLMLQKLRHAMSQAIDSDLLSGIVRVNIAHYGRPHCPIIVPHPQRQPLFIAATMKETGEPCRFKIKHLSKEYLNDGLVRRTGTQLFTEQHVDQTANVDIEYITARFSPRRFHRLLAVAADAGRWINLTFHGIGPKHLQTYMDEYCYRLNLTLRDTPIFHNMLRLSATTAAVPYSVIIQKLACSYY
ncbi:transposase [Paenibacillus validus]|uniref:transposase n=1 Tax=Paenibacillus validus TaxID=44253 RepID=UPI003D268A0B